MKAMVAMKVVKDDTSGAAKAMSKKDTVAALAAASELKQTQVSMVLEHLAYLVGEELKKSHVFTIPGIVRFKTRLRPPGMAGTKNMFGKEVSVKARPAVLCVKAYPVAALNTQAKASLDFEKVRCHS